MKFFFKFSIIVFLIFFACKKPSSILDLSNNEIHIYHEQLAIEDTLLHDIDEIALLDSLLFVIDETEHFYFALFNIKTDSLMFRFGTKGNGPGELMWPLFIECNKQNNAFVVSAINPVGYMYYSIDSLIANPNSYTPGILKIKKRDDNFIYTVNRLNDSLYIGKGQLKDGQFAIINKAGEIISIQEKYPVGDEVELYNQVELGSTYQGEITTKPESNKFAYVSIVGSILEVCEVKEDLLIEKIKTYYFNYPQIVSSNNRTALVKENIIGYKNLYSTKNYFYILYSELGMMEMMGNAFIFNTILVFDWNGKLVKKLKTDINLRTFAVSEDDKIIYGTTANPYPAIVKFNL